ncbi:MAG: metal-dependent transcriptional regulator [Elusimicrobia bacterium]|nr:metal-dependent transcriptional regulator [Elusimicrobiota bacterium]
MSEGKRFRLPSAEREEAEEGLAERWSRREGGEPVVFAAGEEALAADVVRRLRLAERLMTDVLGIAEAKIEEDACRMEHVLSAGTAEAICTLLGHPRFCPHGSAIPRGACCAASRDKAEALLKPLDRLSEGDSGRVAYLVSPDSPDAQRLLSMGLVPGARLSLQQKRPAFVVTAGESTVAMEPAVAEGIIVRLGGKP